MFFSLGHLYFGYCFLFRASDFEFLTEKTEFSVKHYIIHNVSSVPTFYNKNGPKPYLSGVSFIFGPVSILISKWLYGYEKRQLT